MIFSRSRATWPPFPHGRVFEIGWPRFFVPRSKLFIVFDDFLYAHIHGGFFIELVPFQFSHNWAESCVVALVAWAGAGNGLCWFRLPFPLAFRRPTFSASISSSESLRLSCTTLTLAFRLRSTISAILPFACLWGLRSTIQRRYMPCQRLCKAKRTENYLEIGYKAHWPVTSVTILNSSVLHFFVEQ